MKILLIGNGFDIAHGLPTTYNDFLVFMSTVNKISEKREDIGNLIIKEYKNEESIILDGKGINRDILEGQKFKVIESICKLMIDNFCNKKNENDIKNKNEVLINCAQKNIWVKYFNDKKNEMNNNWIDFESEISKGIRTIEEFRKVIINKKRGITWNMDLLGGMIDYSNYSINDLENSVEKIDEFIVVLLEHLNSLIDALKIYLSDYVNKLPLTIKSLDIEELKADKIINFNYTNTYINLYDNTNSCTYDFLHGNASNQEYNNMVLGIDEYLPKKIRNKDTTFIKFKKYYQRIQKKNTTNYKFWLEEMQKNTNKYMRENEIMDSLVFAEAVDNNNTRKNVNELVSNNFIDKEKSYPLNELYIFGHSLDVTDRDVLCDLILNENVETNIFYFSQEDYEKKLINIVKLIGQKELIKRYGKTRGGIKFIKQANMVDL